MYCWIDRARIYIVVILFKSLDRDIIYSCMHLSFFFFVLYFLGETFLNNIIKLTTINYYLGLT